MTAFGETVYFDAVLTPNASLSPRALALVMAVVGALGFCAGLAFFLLGATPMVGFFGLDVLAICLALRWSARRGREETRIRVTAETVTLDHRRADGGHKAASLPTAFARVELDTPLTHQSFLRLEHGRTGFVVGRFLTLDERASLADALRTAILRARRESLA